MTRLGTVAALFILAVGCGGEVSGDGTRTDAPPKQPPSASPNDDLPPPSGARPNDPAQSTTPPPQKIGEPAGSTGGTPFHLVVTNHSKPAGAMKIDLKIDGTPVVTGAFAPNQTFTFDFTVDPGKHKVEARAEYVELVTEETFEVDAPSERWGVLDATTVRCDPCSPAILSWQVNAAPNP